MAKLSMQETLEEPKTPQEVQQNISEEQSTGSEKISSLASGAAAPGASIPSEEEAAETVRGKNPLQGSRSLNANQDLGEKSTGKCEPCCRLPLRDDWLEE